MTSDGTWLIGMFRPDLGGPKPFAYGGTVQVAEGPG
jgi:hypothetical protein